MNLEEMIGKQVKADTVHLGMGPKSYPIQGELLNIGGLVRITDEENNQRDIECYISTITLLPENGSGETKVEVSFNEQELAAINKFISQALKGFDPEFKVGLLLHMFDNDVEKVKAFSSKFSSLAG